MGKILENQVKEVKISNRLSESPSCLVADENEMGGNMERIMKSLGQDVLMSLFMRLTNSAGSLSCPPSLSTAWSNSTLTTS
jgi:HSP90 family molecular chaperone